ncbi:ThiF family adenylyltransferase [Adhaeretor mobilis]|uniref:Sulfur carrier protein ThiS adenylyltransferase n=1 Tax=Adhaeretor mobilis TaxID=1930276 RepID=A0A517MT97_9BACT|nr:ThiF family adenylyltransferase [Adhaeretor mobilis]QDS98082.1 Sulfur carrier protein ThiS adenylyltransferase [Adhaeretor mobilis]
MSGSTNPTGEISKGRYRRQVNFSPLGEAGQQRLAESTVLVCGCGALGSVAAELLVRAGVGRVRIVDRDFLELDNLHRQVLYTEADVDANLPKAIAAAQHLRQINSSVSIEPYVADVTTENIATLADGCDAIVDGTDNFETRYLLNDYAVSTGTPWVFGGCVGAEGQTMAILPGETACLSCLLPEPPPAELQPTCDTAGVLNPIVHTIAAWEAMEALKILSGNVAAVSCRLAVVDLWNNQIRSVGIARREESPKCQTCIERDFPWLEGRRGSATVSLCGRNAVQISASSSQAPSLPALAEKLASIGKVTANDFLLRLEIDEYRITLFADGRAIIAGTDDPAVARTIFNKYFGG